MTISIKITNTTPIMQAWYAFGLNRGYVNTPGVLVSVSESSLDQATRETAFNPFMVTDMKIKTNVQDQLFHKITIITNEVTGEAKSYSITPIDYFDFMHNVPNFVKIYNPKIKIQGKTTLTGSILQNETMTITLNVKQQSTFSSFIANAINALMGKKIMLSGPIPSGGTIVIGN